MFSAKSPGFRSKPRRRPMCGDFDFGRQALLEQRGRPVARRIVSIVLQDEHALPLGNEPVYLGERVIGMTTSAAFGYRIGAPVALAMIDASSLPDTQTPSIEVDVAGVRFAGAVRFGAVFDPEGRLLRNRR